MLRGRAGGELAGRRPHAGPRGHLHCRGREQVRPEGDSARVAEGAVALRIVELLQAQPGRQRFQPLLLLHNYI